MGSHRLQWKFASGSGTTAITSQVTPLGTRVSVYQAAISRGDATAILRTGGAAGTIVAILSAEDGGSDRDPMDSAGGHLEFPDGVHMTISGTALSAGVLVDCGEDP